MNIDRAELANAIAETTGWSVTADPHRVTFMNDVPPQVVIWTVTDAEIGQLRYNENLRAQGYGGEEDCRFRCLVAAPLGSVGPVRRIPRTYEWDRRDQLRVTWHENCFIPCARNDSIGDFLTRGIII